MGKGLGSLIMSNLGQVIAVIYFRLVLHPLRITMTDRNIHNSHNETINSHNGTCP